MLPLDQVYAFLKTEAGAQSGLNIMLYEDNRQRGGRSRGLGTVRLDRPRGRIGAPAGDVAMTVCGGPVRSAPFGAPSPRDWCATDRRPWPDPLGYLRGLARGSGMARDRWGLPLGLRRAGWPGTGDNNVEYLHSAEVMATVSHGAAIPAQDP
jgi:hypothetical protein